MEKYKTLLDNLAPASGKAWLCLVLRILFIVMIGGLTACTNKDVTDLETYVENVKSKTRGRIEPLPEFKPFESATYDVTQEKGPFTPWKLQVATAAVSGRGDIQGIRPDPNRRREVLERYSLDTLKMVGTLKVKGSIWALIMAPDGIVHRVRNGNYMGKNFGKIVKVAEDKVKLREIVPDGLGNWRVRDAAVALSE